MLYSFRACPNTKVIIKVDVTEEYEKKIVSCSVGQEVIDGQDGRTKETEGKEGQMKN